MKARKAFCSSSSSSSLSKAQKSHLRSSTMAAVKIRRGGGAVTDAIPLLFTSMPPIRDSLCTETSDTQDDTVQKCLPLMANTAEDGASLKPYRNAYGLPSIERKRHIKFLENHLLQPFPQGFVSADASRPWFLYWSLSALHLLGEDLAPYYERVVETARAMQNADTGGFGGGNGQLSHLATTYAIVLSLALVARQGVADVVDRRALWKWLSLLKCPDGGFRMSLGGEQDIRGAYCAAVVISLLQIPLQLTPQSPAYRSDGSTNLFTGLGDYVRRCQTYEGGISGQPDTEAHGAYAFCALGCLSILDTPSRSIPLYLDVPRLISWLSSRQSAPEGGLSGRTNKLVDGCYSHWVGGCWPLIDACLRDADQTVPTESLYHREGLIRYILSCCQDQTRRGGLRDKPGKPSDAYHSCYVLSGLSSAQHVWSGTPIEKPGADAAGVALENTIWTSVPFSTEPNSEESEQMFDQEDRVPPIHPVYAIPLQKVRDIKLAFAEKQSF